MRAAPRTRRLSVVDLRPHERPPRDRGWDVLLVGGPAGSGKSRLARLLSRTYAIPLLQVDDLVTALRALTSPEQQPALHRMSTHPRAASDAEHLVQVHLDVCASLHAGLAAVIGDHLRSRAPVVIEGACLTPALAAATSFAGVPAQGRVRAVFVTEPDLDQLVANLASRAPHQVEHRLRAAGSQALGHWIAAQPRADGVHVLVARPWATLAHRAMAVLDR
jgi:2-phosphoglycerate kinase